MTTFGYDTTGLISLTNNGNQTSFDYDPSSRLTSWTFGVGSPAISNWTASYTSSTVTKITDGDGNIATYTTAWPQTTIKDPLGNVHRLPARDRFYANSRHDNRGVVRSVGAKRRLSPRSARLRAIAFFWSLS